MPHQGVLHGLPRQVRTAGFTLVEVLVAVVITAVGLLGLARMQAVSLSTTSVAGARALIALQTGSLASAMHANPGYWTSLPDGLQFTATGDKLVVGKGTLGDAATDGCTTFCTPDQMAATDVRGWMTDMRDQFPTYVANVDCSSSGTPENPALVNCRIGVTWTERRVAVSGGAEPGVTAAGTAASFSVIVKP